MGTMVECWVNGRKVDCGREVWEAMAVPQNELGHQEFVFREDRRSWTVSVDKHFIDQFYRDNHLDTRQAKIEAATRVWFLLLHRARVMLKVDETRMRRAG